MTHPMSEPWVNWQPIETCPKERDVLLYCECWEHTFGPIQIGQIDHGGDWNFQSELSLEDCEPDFLPTHWAEMPAPPTN